ncbi:hypothetical protein ACP275_08G199000 [Erythranthe tilingii]
MALSNRYYRPYRVVEKIGAVAYRLLLPTGSKVHDVFHVSLLKKKISSKHLPSPSLPFTTEDGIPQVSPARILDQRIDSATQSAQVLVQWSGESPTTATWEDLHELLAKFPTSDPWGQGFSPPGGNVMAWGKKGIRTARARNEELLMIGGDWKFEFEHTKHALLLKAFISAPV